MELKDLQSTPLTLDDLKPDVITTTKLPPLSVAGVAATKSLLEGNASEEGYVKNRDSLTDPDGRQQFLDFQQAERDRMKAETEAELANLLPDPSVSLDTKDLFIQNLQNLDQTLAKMSTMESLSEQAVIANSGQDETAESEQSRINWADKLGEVNDIKRQQQALINRSKVAQAAESAGFFKNAKDFGELLAPFAEWIHVDQLARKTGSSRINLMGQQRADIIRRMEEAPLNEKVALTQELIRIVEETDRVILPDGNAVTALADLERMAGLTDYTDTERWLDNLSSIADIAGVGGVLRWVAKGGKEVKAVDKVTDLEREVTVMTTKTDTAPTAPAKVIKDANPEQSKVMHNVVKEDETGNAAEALYGTTKEEALADDLLPEPEKPGGKSQSKPIFDEDPEVQAVRTEEGNIHLTEKERATAINSERLKLEDVEGMIPHTNSMKIKALEDGSTEFSVMYHPINNGFATVGRAVENAMYAFRKFKVEEKDLSYFYRDGTDWVETTPKELAARAELRAAFTSKKKKIPAELKEVDYAVGLKYKFQPQAGELNLERLSIKRNWLDAMPSWIVRAKQGSVTQNILPVDNVLPTQITRATSKSVDRGTHLHKLLLDQYRNFSEDYVKLPKLRRGMMKDYIEQANAQGIPMTTTDLAARGFNAEERQLLKAWKQANDTLWHVANADMVINLRNKGFYMFRDSNNTNLVVKPVKEKGVPLGTPRTFDPASNSFVKMDRAAIQQHYANGGEIARLDEPVKHGNLWIEYIKVDNTPQNGYLRVLRDNDKVLNYREGYYPVAYDANWFITQTMRADDGTEFEKAIVAAGSEQDAIHALKQLQATYPDKKFTTKQDRALGQRTFGGGESGWSVSVSQGLTNQKIRGVRLGDASAGMQNIGNAHLVDPLEAVAKQVAMLARKVSVRKVLDDTKERWIQNYFDELQLPLNQYGEKWFPSSINQLAERKAGVNLKTLADARTLYNYVDYMEHGYINSIDDGFKALLQTAADIVSPFSKKAEDILRGSSKVSPTSTLKGTVFKLFLAANPLRQVIVQGHQSIQLLALFPQHAPQVIREAYQISRALTGLPHSAETAALLKELQRSGILDAVDSNNIVRKELIRLADQTWGQKTGKVLNTPLRISQRAGFDIGEQLTVVTSYLAHRADKVAKNGGKALTRADLDEVAGAARIFTGNMNRAGDMPYNINSLNVVAQFLQVPHKLGLQPLFSRSLTRQQRAQLLAWNTVMYGVPAGAVGYLTGFIENPMAKDAIQFGLEDVLLNEMLTGITGEDQQINWGDLAPTDIYGTGDFAVALLTGDIGKLVAEAPAVSLFFGPNPRLTNLFKQTAMLVNPAWNYDDPNLKIKYTDVVRSSLNLFSGFSNAFKAQYAAKTGEKMSSLGSLTAEDVTTAEAIMQGLGFVTHTEEARFQTQQSLFGGTEYATSDMQRDVQAWYDMAKRIGAGRGQSVREAEFANMVLGEGWRVFGLYEPEARQFLLNAIQKDADKGEYSFVEGIVKQWNLMDPAEVRRLIGELPQSQMKDDLLHNFDTYLNERDKTKEYWEKQQNG